MPSIEGHPSFPLNIRRDQKIWRYMDFTKFIYFLTNKSLWFNRSDKFSDPFEGTFPSLNLQQDIRGNKDWYLLEPLIEHMRQFTYLSCWYISDYESAAMWKLYAQSNEAIAIQSTYEKLHMAMPSDCFIGEVTYIDYRNDRIDIRNTFNPHMIKRMAFAHERELRALIQDNEIPSKKNPDGSSTHDYKVVNDKLGINIPVAPIDLVEKVYVAPMAHSWFKSLVKDICIAGGFKETLVITSELEDEPY